MNQYDYLKDKLHDYKVKVDKEKLWRETSHAIPQRRKKRILLFFFFTGLVLSSAWIGYSHTASSKALSMITNNNRNESGEVNQKQFEHQSIVSSTLAMETGIQKPHKAETGIPSKRNKKSNTIMQASYPVAMTDGTDNHSSDPQVFQSANKDFSKISSLTKMNDIILHHMPTIQEETILNAEKITIATTSPEPLIEDTPHLREKSMDPMAVLQSPISPIYATLNFTDDESHHVPIIPSDSHKKRISFQVMSAIGFSTLAIKAHNSESKELADLYKHSVKNLENISVAISGKLPVSNTFSLEAGLGYNQWTVETKQQITSYNHSTREGVTNIIIDENGVQQSVTGTVNAVQVVHKNLIRYTQFNSLAAEATLHKILWCKNRMTLSAYVKGSLVFNDHIKGSAYNAEGELTKFSNSDNPFETQSSFRIGGGIKINYPINRYLFINGTIGYHPVKYNIQLSQQQIGWTHSIIQGDLGMSYRFK
ncbi:MAG: hypothetical protein ABJB16_05350 [Saprospiraceae bacterium]